MSDTLVIGAGPAGLMAAQELAATGRRVLVVDGKPSVGRKLLMAGKSGLNLTKDEPPDQFLANYCEAAENLRPMLEAFGPQDVAEWARSLGQDVFTGSSGRVFPKTMKASPLLRAWLRRLDGLGVERRVRWKWLGWNQQVLEFDTPQGRQVMMPERTILALGGASWSRLGSDGAWRDMLCQKGIPVRRFQPANAGLRVDWSPYMSRVFGMPLKNIAFLAAEKPVVAEAVISSRGLEGGGIYAISRSIREKGSLHVDLVPGLNLADVTSRLSRGRGKDTVANLLRKSLRLDPAKQALLMEFGRPLPSDLNMLARLVKFLPILHSGFAPFGRGNICGRRYSVRCAGRWAATA